MNHSRERRALPALSIYWRGAHFQEWADLAIAPVHSTGTDKALYRLGSDMAVRLPRIEGATEQVDKEQRWLPRLAPLLPLATPVPRALGTPGESYPWQWSLYQWLEGETATIERLADLCEAARDLAQFVAALPYYQSTNSVLAGIARRAIEETLADQMLSWAAAKVGTRQRR